MGKDSDPCHRAVQHLQIEVTRARAELEALRAGFSALMCSLAEKGGHWLLDGAGEWLDDGSEGIREEIRIERLVNGEYRMRCGAAGIDERVSRVRLTPAFPADAAAVSNPSDETVVRPDFGKKPR